MFGRPNHFYLFMGAFSTSSRFSETKLIIRKCISHSFPACFCLFCIRISNTHCSDCPSSESLTHSLEKHTNTPRNEPPTVVDLDLLSPSQFPHLPVIHHATFAVRLYECAKILHCYSRKSLQDFE